MNLKTKNLRILLSGAAAGIANGLFGAGGGMLLVPLLSTSKDLEPEEVFPASVAIIFPICIVSLSIGASGVGLPWKEAIPYLIGGAIGGFTTGFADGRIPTLWLHRLLGGMILWGGIRYLC